MPRRNAPCPCGSGRKYKHCCWGQPHPAAKTPGTGLLSTVVLRFPLMVGFGLALVTLAAYLPGFDGVFLFDDSGFLADPALHSLSWPWNFAVNVRRPLLYLTLALNYAVGGSEPFSYHVVNFSIHLTAGLILWGLLRRSLTRCAGADTSRREAMAVFSAAVALLWLLHPLQTQAVSYIIQRAESLAALFYLLTLYAAVRFMDTRSTSWLGGAWLAALAGGLTKETAVTVPLAVLLYDRAYVSLSFREAWQQHRKLYLGLALTWAAMLFLLAVTRPEAVPTAGFSYQGISPGRYALNQASVIWHYLRLVLWPHPLVFDYEWPARGLAEQWPAVLGLGGLLLATGVVYRRYPRWGFPAVFVFLTLLPSSSLIPLKDLAFEHRMYLALAGCLVLLVAAVTAITTWVFFDRRTRGSILFIGLLSAVVAYGVLTYQRNLDYQDAMRMWTKTVEQAPNNARGRNNLGELYLRQGEWPTARRLFEKALTLQPEYADAHLNMSTVLAHMGDLSASIEYSREAVRIRPENGIAYNNLGAALSQMDRYAEAAVVLKKAVDLGFQEPGVYQNLGVAYAQTGRPLAAIRCFERVLELDPGAETARAYLDEVQAKVRSAGSGGEE